MGTDVKPTELDLRVARDGIRLQLSQYYPDVSLFIEKHDLYAFLENQAQVIAHLRAEVRKLNNCLNEKEPTIFDRY